MEKKELTPEELEELKNRHIRSFVLRRGHISNAQKRALEEELPQYAVEYSASPLDFASVFGRKAPVVLEIGCGMGETTAAIAAAHPEVNFWAAKSLPPASGHSPNAWPNNRSRMCASFATTRSKSSAT